MPRIPPALRLTVIDRAQGKCEYCQVPQEAELVEYEIDHIIAGQHGGETTLDNLAYACFDCNHYKGPNLASLDPQTGERTWLFNPRIHKWGEHFQLHSDGTVTSQTPEGRATVQLLCFNISSRVLQRSYTIAAGKLSPTSEQVS